jgi:hypothetical protein
MNRIAPQKMNGAGPHARPRFTSSSKSSKKNRKGKIRKLLTRHQRMLADLARSGLDESDVKRLRCKAVSGKRAKELLGLRNVKLPDGYVIPYFDAHGQPIEGVFRWRELAHWTRRAAGGRREPGPKYLQPRGSEPRLYFDPTEEWHNVERPIVITEGEKKAAFACKMGIPTIGLGGVYSWKVPKSDPDELLPEFDDILDDDVTVEVCFDSDLDTNPNVRQALARLTATSEDRGCDVKVIRLPAGPSGEKVGLDDFLVAAGTKSNGKFSRKRAYQAFEKLARHDPPTGEPEAVVRRVDSVKAVPLQTLWPRVLWIGKPTLLVGDPGLGKSLITADITARVTTGNDWPCQTRSVADPANVVLLSAEDDVADTIRPRLEAAGADLKRVFTLDGIRDDKSGDPSRVGWVSLAKHLPIVAKTVRQQKARLLVVDPISAYLGTIDSHRNSEVRAILAELGQLASDVGCAVLCVSHLNKGGEGSNAVYRVSGSLAFVAAARSVYAIAKDPDDPEHRLMLPIKVNLAGDMHGLGYKIDADDENCPYVEWDAEPVENERIDEILHPPRDRAKKKQEAEIEEWLRGKLKKGVVPSKRIFNQASERNYSERAVRRVLGEIGAVCEQQGFHGGWAYTLEQAS